MFILFSHFYLVLKYFFDTVGYIVPHVFKEFMKSRHVIKNDKNG